MRTKLGRISSRLHQLDEKLVHFAKLRANLLAALAVLALCVWGAATDHAWFVVGILAVGGISYFFGMVIALVFSCIFLIIGVSVASGALLQFNVQLLQIAGYLLIAGLGYRHKEQKELQVEQQQQIQHIDSLHSPQMIPWSVTNEVRTSLAAVRFLLFPLNQNEETDATIQKASAELSRLEHLFNQIEQEKLQELHNNNRQVH